MVGTLYKKRVCDEFTISTLAIKKNLLLRKDDSAVSESNNKDNSYLRLIPYETHNSKHKYIIKMAI